MKPRDLFGDAVIAVLAPVFLALVGLTCYQRPGPAEEQAAGVQNEEGEPGCALPGRVNAVACNDGYCLVCYEVGGVPRQEQRIPSPSVCVSLRAGGCR